MYSHLSQASRHQLSVPFVRAMRLVQGSLWFACPASVCPSGKSTLILSEHIHLYSLLGPRSLD